MSAEGLRRSTRERKTVERYSNSEYEKKPIEGEGKILKEIPEIKEAFKRCPRDIDFLKIVHKTLYGTEGKQETRRKDILKFNGIKGENEEETKTILERRKAWLERQTFAALIEMCRLFCLAGAAKEKTKDKYAEEIVKFIEKPGEKKPVVTLKENIVDIPEPVEEVPEEVEKKPKKKAAKKEEKKGKTTKKESKGKSTKKDSKKETPKKTKKESKKEDKKEKTKTPKKDNKKDAKKPKVEKKEKETPKKENKKVAKK